MRRQEQIRFALGYALRYGRIGDHRRRRTVLQGRQNRSRTSEAVLRMSAPFFDAIKQGDRHALERLLVVDPSLIHARENGLSPILVAAYHHQPAIASFLADKTVGLT